MVGQRATTGTGTPADTITASLIDDEDLRRLFDYWRVQRQGRPMPTRGDIDPLDIGWALSRIFLVDYIPAEGLVYRLAGADIASVFGRGNLKGLQPATSCRWTVPLRSRPPSCGSSRNPP